jgi:hypothetical protein
MAALPNSGDTHGVNKNVCQKYYRRPKKSGKKSICDDKQAPPLLRSKK